VKTATLAVAAFLLVASAVVAEPAAPPAAAAPAPAAPAPTATPNEDAAPATNVVRYANDKVTLDVKDLPAAAVINQIASQAGARVTGSVGNVSPVTANWTDLPLKEALEHILGTQNFTLTYSEKGELRTIALRGGQQDTQPGPAEAAKDDPSRTTSAEYALFKAFDIRDTVPVDGAVATRLGRSDAPWDLLTNTSYADGDPAVRRSAVKSGMVAFESNPALRDKVLGTANDMSAAQLAAFARAYMYHRAEDFVRNVKRTTTMPDVRKRASDVLRELRKIPYTGPKPPEGQSLH
jgi:hypothetical protein